MNPPYPKRLIEVDLPIREISAHARREKSIRHVHISMEFDAARKIAQGLGAHLEKLDHVVEVKGDKARLLSVAERAKALFGKDAAKADAPKSKGKAKSSKKQLGLFAEIEAAEREGLLGEGGVPRHSITRCRLTRDEVNSR